MHSPTVAMIAVVVAAGSLLPAAALAGDDLFEYGAYLSGECTTCHLLSGEMVGAIPPIIGLDEESFVEAMNDYASGVRENKSMGSVARALDDEMIASLARYFGAQEIPGDEPEPEPEIDIEIETKIETATESE